MMPKRIRLRRAKGWRKPAGCVVVSRPSRWGNPFHVMVSLEGREPIVTADCRGLSVQLFRTYAEARRQVDPDWLAPLRGKDLACWCPLDEPCHADVLIELANEVTK